MFSSAFNTRQDTCSYDSLDELREGGRDLTDLGRWSM